MTSPASSLIHTSAQVSSGDMTCSGIRGVAFSAAWLLLGASAQDGTSEGSKVRVSLMSLSAYSHSSRTAYLRCAW